MTDEFVLIINAFAALNVLGIYYRRRCVNRERRSLSFGLNSRPRAYLKGSLPAARRCFSVVGS